MNIFEDNQTSLTSKSQRRIIELVQITSKINIITIVTTTHSYQVVQTNVAATSNFLIHMIYITFIFLY